MTMETVSAFLGWCTIINVGILIWWFLFVTVAHDFTYRWSSKALQDLA